MALTSLVVCADLKAVQVLSQILRELNIAAEHCGELASAAGRLASEHFDAVVIDCQDQMPAIELIAGVRKSPMNRSTLIIGLVDGREQVRDIFDGLDEVVVEAGFRGAGGEQPAGGARSDGTGKANQTEDRAARTGVDYLRRRGECGGHAAGLERGWIGHPVGTAAASTLQGLLSIQFAGR